MKRREFLQGVGTGLLSTVIMPGFVGRVLIQQVGSGIAPRPVGSAADRERARIVVAGIGPAAACATALLSRSVPDISCHQVVFDPAGKGADLNDLLTIVRSCDLLFLLTTFDDPACQPIFEAVGATAREWNVVTVGVVPDAGILQPDLKVVSSLWHVSSRALASLPPQGAGNTFGWDGWDGYAMRHLVATVADIILRHSLVCVDFADVRSILTSGAEGKMGAGVDRLGNAAHAALRAFERLKGQGLGIGEASAFLACVRSSSGLTMDDFDEAAKVIHETVPDEANLIVGIVMDESMGGNMKVTILGAAGG